MARKSWLVAACLLGGVLQPGWAATTTLVDDDILIGNPMGASFGGVSELVAFCDPDAPAQGVDGITFAVPPAARGKSVSLTTTGAAGLDADVYWYDQQCRAIGTGSLDQRGTGNETGTVPSNAHSGVVDLIAGAQAHVRLVVTL
jgi:hypothetical protein